MWDQYIEYWDRIEADNHVYTDKFIWFSDHLDTLRTHEHSPKVNVSLYATRSPNTTGPSEQRRGSVVMGDHVHRAHMKETATDDDENTLEQGITGGDGGDPEKAATPSLGRSTARTTTSDESMASTYNNAAAHNHHHSVKAGRPDTATLIREAVSSTPSHQRVLVAACGPDGLMRVVRDTTASLIRGDGPGLELHCEQFGW